MTWHYAAGGERHGPVDDAELDRLIAAGVITREEAARQRGESYLVADLAGATPHAAS
jgi:hypothetical protein